MKGGVDRKPPRETQVNTHNLIPKLLFTDVTSAQPFLLLQLQKKHILQNKTKRQRVSARTGESRVTNPLFCTVMK